MFIRLVEDGLGIRFFGAQDVVQDASDLECRRGDRLRGSELGAHTLEELSKVALGAAQRVGS